MAERSFAARRAGRLVDRSFPVAPTLVGEGAWAGLAFVRPEEGLVAALRPWRDEIVALRRGAIDGGPDAPDLLVVIFARPVAGAAERLAGALPLVAATGAELRSFVARDAVPAELVRIDPAEIRRISLWWNGRQHRIAIDTLARVSLAALWDRPRITVHEAVRAVVGVPAAGGGRRGSGERVAKISHADVPAFDDGTDVIGDVDARLRDLQERTTLGAIFGRLFRPRVLGEGGADGEPGEGSAPREPEPGLMQDLMGWVRWHTPLGAALRRQFAERMELVEQLIAKGDLDSALKLALMMGKPQAEDAKPSSRYPNMLPGMRASLDFNLPRSAHVSPIFSDDSYAATRQRYIALAERLEREGDYRRAAYIQSQLLEDHRAAVLTLERGELYREAARLALQAGLEPVLTIRLLFQAGDRDAALALARRFACFDQLAEDSRDAHPEFHAAVVRAWTQALVASGQPLRALQVTDALAAPADADPALRDARREWLATALRDCGGDGFSPELAVRALTCLDAGDAATQRWITAFPDGAAEGLGDLAGVLGAVQAMVRGEDEHAADWLLALPATFARVAPEGHAEQAGFWSGPAQPILDAVVRGTIAHAAGRIGQADVGALQDLLVRARLPVLAADLGKLRKLNRGGAVQSRTYRLLPPDVVRPAVERACVLGTGHVLLWRESGLLELLDRHGAPLWRQRLSDVTALVPVGGGPNAIVIQALGEGRSRLTRFASHQRQFHAIGSADLRAHHDVTTESQWLVQFAGEIGALDLAALCAPAPEIAFLWSCKLTEQVSTLAFAHFAEGPHWVTVDVGAYRRGVMEVWSLDTAGRLHTRICFPPDRGEGAERIPWVLASEHLRIEAAGDGGRKATLLIWSDETEQRARREVADRAPANDLSWIQSGDLGRAAVQAAAGKVVIRPLAKRLAPFVIETAAGLACVARSVGALGVRAKGEVPVGACLFADPQGRLVMVDAESGRVLVV